MSGFENFGRPRDLPDHAKLECGICWTIYDPAAGDPQGRALPGTPFSALPDDWTCPNCDAPAAKFLVMADDA